MARCIACAPSGASLPAVSPRSIASKTASSSPKLLTLVIVQQGERLLLGRKKRGFGAGYINGFGGKVEPGERIVDAALRELHEEAGIVACDIHKRGVLHFQFDDSPRPWETHVFAVNKFDGVPVETDEMQPLWINQADLDYSNMWADDIHWYPLFLQGKCFKGVFSFTNTTELVEWRLQEVDASSLEHEARLQSSQPANC